MKKTITIFEVEGPTWKNIVEVDTNIHSEKRDMYIEAGTAAIEKHLSASDDFQCGPMLVVKEKGKKGEAVVNSYICLINASQHSLAEDLRERYKKQSGQDLSLDKEGFSM